MSIKENISEQKKLRSLLRTVNSQLASLPKYVKKEPKTRLESIFKGATNTVQAVRRGLKILQGQPSSASLNKQKTLLRRSLNKLEEYQNTGFYKNGKFVDLDGEVITNPTGYTLTTKAK